jgi:hypothetical protein
MHLEPATRNILARAGYAYTTSGRIVNDAKRFKPSGAFHNLFQLIRVSIRRRPKLHFLGTHPPLLSRTSALLSSYFPPSIRTLPFPVRPNPVQIRPKMR